MYIQEFSMSPLTVAGPNDYSKLPPPGTYLFDVKNQQTLYVAVLDGTGVTVSAGAQGAVYNIDPATFMAVAATATNAIATGTIEKKGNIAGTIPVDRTVLTDPSDSTSFQDYPEFKSKTTANATDAFKFLLNVGGPCLIDVENTTQAYVPLYPTAEAGRLGDTVNNNVVINNLILHTTATADGVSTEGFAYDIPRIEGTAK